MTREEAIKIFRSDELRNLVNYYSTTQLQDMIDTIVSAPSLPSNLDEAANRQAALEQPYRWEEEQDGSFGVTPLFVMSNIRSAFKAGAEWMAGQGWSLDGEVKDQPTGCGDFEIYLDYDMNKMDGILDEICDYVNANYPYDDNRYKVVVQIRKK